MSLPFPAVGCPPPGPVACAHARARGLGVRGCPEGSPWGQREGGPAVPFRVACRALFERFKDRGHDLATWPLGSALAARLLLGPWWTFVGLRTRPRPLSEELCGGGLGGTTFSLLEHRAPL